MPRIDLSGEELRRENDWLMAHLTTSAPLLGLFGLATVGLYRTTPAGQILLVNPALVRLLGFDSGEELTQRNLEREGFITPSARHAFLQRVEAEGHIEGHETEWLRRDGTVLHLRESVHAVRGADGRTLYYEGVVEDLTANHNAEAALRETNRLLTSLIDAAPSAILVLDGNERISRWSPAAERLLGWSAAEILGQPLPCAPEQVDECRSALQRARRGDAPVRHDLRVQHRDGAQISVDLAAAGLSDDRGDPGGIVAILTDMTATHRLLRELDRYREEKALILDAMQEVVTYHDREFRLLWANRAAGESVGLSVERLLGRRCHEVWGRRADPCENCAAERAMAERRVCRGETCMPDGRVWSISAHPICDGRGEVTGVVATSVDVTGQRRATERIRRRSEELEIEVAERAEQVHRLELQRDEIEKLAAAGRMASRIAHEINNPLAGLRNAFLLIKDAVPADHRYFGYVARIEKEIDRITWIVRQMYGLHKSQREAPSEFLIEDCLQDVIALLAPTCREHETRFHVAEEFAGGRVVLHEGMLRQVLYNLLQNAVEASPPCGVVSIRGGIAGDRLQLSVVDQGVGIAPEVAARIFEPFFTTKGELGSAGLGLGLSICRTIVQAMNGTIDFGSAPDGGTVFHVSLPFDAAGGVEA